MNMSEHEASPQRYVDPKRYLWLTSLSGPFVLPLAVGLYLWLVGRMNAVSRRRGQRE